jgi:hypothetical protein
VGVAKKNDWRDYYLTAALCPGAARPWTPDRAGYEAFFGCWLNREELLAQAAWVVLVGTGYAGAEDDIPAQMFTATHRDESTAFEAMVAANNARDMARSRRKVAAKRAGVETRSVF